MFRWGSTVPQEDWSEGGSRVRRTQNDPGSAQKESIWEEGDISM